MHPTDGRQVISDAGRHGLEPILLLENQPSLIKNKENVTWTKLVFQNSTKTNLEMGRCICIS